MVFRRRFQTGTLGRSIRKFGRFPRPGFQRKQFAFYYATAFQELDLSVDPEPTALVLASNAVLAPATSIATGAMVPVRNVSMDLEMTLQMLPDIGAISGPFGNVYVHWMIYKADTDEPIISFDSIAATHSAIKWGTWTPQLYGTGGSTGASDFAHSPHAIQKVRTRFKVSKLERDEEIVFLAAWSQTEAKAGWLDQASIQFVQRVRYEVP